MTPGISQISFVVDIGFFHSVKVSFPANDWILYIIDPLMISSSIPIWFGNTHML